MTTSGRKWFRRKRERPDEIRAAALVEFSNKGFASATMACIARRAGITKGTIYLYYASKLKLFETIRDELTRAGAQDACSSLRSSIGRREPSINQCR